MFSVFTMARTPGTVLLVGLALLGCGRSLPPQADPDVARTALRTALDAWQAGETSASLARRNPSLYFNEPRCNSDVRLVKYQLEEGHATHGQSVRLTAQLTLEMKPGTTTERKARYLIDTAPAVVIVAE